MQMLVLHVERRGRGEEEEEARKKQSGSSTMSKQKEGANRVSTKGKFFSLLVLIVTIQFYQI